MSVVIPKLCILCVCDAWASRQSIKMSPRGHLKGSVRVLDIVVEKEGSQHESHYGVIIGEEVKVGT